MRPQVFPAAVLAAAGLLAACSPPLDWRRVRPEGTALEAMFPCRPARQTRRVPLSGAPLEMSLWACVAGGSTYALSSADVADPARVGAALADLQAAMRLHVRGTPASRRPAAVPGMTPNAQAGQLLLQGRLPDGKPVRLQAVFFAHGTRIYQASIVGESADPEAAEAFFSGLRLPS